jgi:hypothetical protein
MSDIKNKIYIKKFITAAVILFSAVNLLAPRAAYALTGRTKLIAGQTVNAAAIGPIYMSAAVGHDIYHYSVPTSAFLGFYYTYNTVEERTMSSDRALFINSTSIWSSVFSYFTANMFDFTTDEKILISAMTNGLSTGTAAVISGGRRISSEDTALINFTGLWGTVLLLETASSIKPESTGMAKYVIWTSLTASLTAGYFAADRWEIPADRLVAVSLYGVLGAFSGAGFAWVMYFKSKRAYNISLLAGTVLGLYGGWLLTDRPMRENTRPFRNPERTQQQVYFTLGSTSW